MNITLCDERINNTHIVVEAEITPFGELVISGQDIGRAPRETFGSSDYEYFYRFDLENTSILRTLLEKKWRDYDQYNLLNEFGGIDGVKRMREFCVKHGIRYTFHSHF